MALAVALSVPLGASASAAPAAPTGTEDGPVQAGLFVHKVENLSDDFATGVDVSTVLSLEESGVVFRDADGAPADIFATLAANGVNTVRIRVWNDPYDAAGNGYGGGDVDVPRAVEIGERATAAGLKVLVDFHYSDFWADPARQLAPKAWVGLSDAETVTALHDFTRDTLQSFEDADVAVSMVQIGNETNNGIGGYSRAGTAIDQQFANLIGAGSAAAREVLPDALVAVHFTNPETPGRYATYAAGLAAFGVDYDVFASSYYPYWHGTLDNLTAVLSDIASTYGKQVMVAETSWARTLDDGDGFANSIGSGSIGNAYPATVQGQATELRDVIAAVAAVGPAGIGVFYWEPAWIPVGPPSALSSNRVLWERDGSGWATSFAAGYDPVNVGTYYGGSSWDNQALFDWDGRPLESLRTFSYVFTGAVAPREATSIDPVTITVTDGEAISLPATVEVDYNDGSTEHPGVTWSGAVRWIRGPGVYSIPGTTSTGVAVVASVTVLAPNLVQNHSFEEGDHLSPWTFGGYAYPNPTGDASDGEYAVTFYSAAAYTASASQTITGVPAGTYTLSATTQGTNSPATDVRTLSATSSAGSWTAPLSITGYNEFHTASVPKVVVGSDGIVTVRADLSLSAGAWGVLDDMRLVKEQTSTVDTRLLRGALSLASRPDRSKYSAASIARLDESVAIGNVVVAGSRASRSDVLKATGLIAKALLTLRR